MEGVLPLIIFGLLMLLLVALLSMIWPPDSPWSPWWRTNGKVAREMCKVGRITAKDVVYDLGCGDGTVLLTAAKEYGARGVGVDIDPLRVWIAKLRIYMERVNKKVKIRRMNLFQTDVSEATVIIVYLIPKTLNRLEKKLRKELKSGTRIISYVYEIEYLPKIAEDKKHQIYIYKIP